MHCTVTFHDLVIRHADMVFTHGVEPSVCHMLAVPGPIPSVPGDLLFSEDTGNEVRLRDCAINRATLEPVDTARGIRLVLQVMDRRWRWRYRRISGEYNQRHRDGESINSRTYQELITLLLDALGEFNYEITIPDETLEGPHVDWRHVRADLELATLLDRIGCIVTLGLDDLVRVVVNGRGPLYPETGRERMPTLDSIPSTLPAKVTVQFAETKLQAPLLLEPVGIQVGDDGTFGDILPLEELDYEPAAGWEYGAGDWYPDLAGATRIATLRWMLARRAALKWWKIYSYQRAGVVVGDTPNQVSLVQELITPAHNGPFEETLITSYADHEWAQSGPHKAYLYAPSLWLGDLAGEETLYARDTDHFHFDGERGLVCCDTQMVSMAGDAYPDLEVVCVFHIRADEDGGPLHCHRFSIQTGVNNHPDAAELEAVIQVPDRRLLYVYDVNTETWTDNKNEINIYAQDLASSYLRTFYAIPQAEQEWVGLVPYPVAGNVHMMRWLLAADRCRTYGYKNLESSLIGPVHHERRLRQIAEGLLV